jgi:hypothetical protein
MSELFKIGVAQILGGSALLSAAIAFVVRWLESVGR